MAKLHKVEAKYRMKGDRKAKWHEVNVYKNKSYADKIAKKYRKHFGKDKVRVRTFSWPPKRRGR